MQKEHKQIDAALEAIITRVNNLKSAIAAMVFLVEREYKSLHWTNFLDNFALTSGHLSSLSKILSHEKSPNIRCLTVLPLLLNPEKDDELINLTEGRIPTFAHDLVPDYLRTKPDPLVEQKLMLYEAKVANLTYDSSHKQTTQHNKVINHVCEIANKAKDDWEGETESRSAQVYTNDSSDTYLLICAVGNGKGLKSDTVHTIQPSVAIGNSLLIGRPSALTSNHGPLVGQIVKAPSAIKTNIKAASQLHPYGR